MVEEDNVEIIDEENEDAYSNDDLYNISSWGADLSFRELITMYDENELQKPELQRKYVWDKVEASRFIDSLLLGLPVPSIFLANTTNNNKLIIDGFQRIMTVYDYVKGIWSKDNKVFKLSNSRKINERWRDKAYAELNDSEKKKIRSTTIHAIIFEQKEPSEDDTSLYQIFERINTSGRSLFPQEIRNCVYQGAFNNLLFELNKNSNWRKLYGLIDEDSRMRDLEHILRFFALDTEYIKTCKKSTISLKKHLNEFMGNSNSQEKAVIATRKDKFNNVINFLYTNFGEEAFYNISSKDPRKIRKRFYPTIFDSICVATSIAFDTFGGNIPTVDLRKKQIELLRNDEFKTYITQGTMQLNHIHGRFKMTLKAFYGLDYE
jgi:uncharacterized protein with ParB-like and HNH nuclease domain